MKRMSIEEYAKNDNAGFDGNRVLIKSGDEVWYLPELTGSEKQIDWAGKIRKDFIEHFFIRAAKTGVTGEALEKGIENLIAFIESKTEAKYYIDNRSQM